MFFKLNGNHQGANPSLYRKYGQELLMWAAAKCTFLVALCRRNAHFLDPCITACSSSYYYYYYYSSTKSATTAQTVNGAHTPIT